MLEIVLQNLISPVILFFVLGLFACFVKSDLKFPTGLSEFLSIYLLIAIGLKGGIELSEHNLITLIKPLIGALFLGVLIPVIMFFICRWVGLDVKNSIGLAATYGSVSIVTYGAAISFLSHSNVSFESYMNAMVVIMESPAILVSLLMLKSIEAKQSTPGIRQGSLGITAGRPLLVRWIEPEVVRESLFGKSVLLLVGSLLVGFVVGQEAIPVVKPLFIDLYNSFLILFLLNMGLVAGQRLSDVRRHGIGLLALAVLMPITFGMLGVVIGSLAGLSQGGVTLMGVLAASSSYIAAPAALRTSVPDANPSIYLGLSLGITFPFNLTLGIPLYYIMAEWIVKL
ncbi:sodium-dependent bicarbonate transport family permease [Ammoniphilus sp. CFH 90114]|uniref:sodium-dependent bicarbonate transport family permease n=1 Tax=Ammoniphilus sp. CFH 90114 TaxID=2493665 RepID=UPI00100F539B|nr:sodium-dependent bicarbonate transport family permease [Ammoniphilus sp. CFH 90114]RXT15290.1 sodium-dependent bicarbonate transport family permease [Ammoniphilus sp. CFH 90114]